MENKHLSDNELKPRKWLLYVLIIINIVIIIVLANKIITDRQNKVNDENSIFDKFFDTFNDTMNNNNVSEIDKKAFNASFEMYVGTKWGLQVSRLIDEIITNNKTNSEHIITVVCGDINSTDSDEIRSIKKNLDDWTDYEVILDYDENGFVNLITIEQ